MLLMISLLMSGLIACSNEMPDPELPEGLTEGTSTLTLPYILSSHMVVQQQSVTKFWGKATPEAKVTVETTWSKGKRFEVIVPADGRWEVSVPTPAASFEPQTVVVRDSQKGRIALIDVLVGEVWMCTGQSNMEHPMRGFGSVAQGNYQPVLNAEAEMAATDIPTFRYFKDKYQLTATPQFNTKESSWDSCNALNSPEYEAVAFFFGRRLSKALNVPIGIIGCAYGGTRIESWMSVESLKRFDPSEYKDAAELGDPNHKSAPGNIFNGMVMPVMPYAIRGWLWYQGESNRDNYASYARLMQEMVALWRSCKGDSENKIPFYYVQIAPFSSSDLISGANLRQAQMDALSLIPNSGIVCVSDAGDESTIHYPNKKLPGERLAMWAENKVYKVSDVDPMAPCFESMVVDGNDIVVTLSHSEGLNCPSGTVEWGRIASGSADYRECEVTLEGNKLRFHGGSTPNPVAVRYCFRTWHVGTVFNGAGLPVHPFQQRLD